jgi:hypothetical protein
MNNYLRSKRLVKKELPVTTPPSLGDVKDADYHRGDEDDGAELDSDNCENREPLALSRGPFSRAVGDWQFIDVSLYSSDHTFSTTRALPMPAK